MYSYRYKDGYIIYDKYKSNIKYSKVENNDLEKTSSGEICSKEPVLDDEFKREKVNKVSLTYFSTPFCNLTCNYCYERKTKNQYNMEVMSAQQQYDTFNIIKNAFPNAKTFKLNFFGGEPFLAKKEIFAFIEMINEDYKVKNEKFPQLVTITNGTLLTEEDMEFIHRYFASITFSIDGTKNIHDFNRIYKSGQGTYEDVISNVEKFNKINEDKKIFTACEVTMTDTYFKESDDYVIKPIWALLKKLKFQDVDFVPVEDENSKVIIKEEKIELIAREIVDLWYNDILTDSAPFQMTVLIDFLSLIVGKYTKNNNLCGAGYNNFAVDSNLNIYNCQTAVFTEKKSIGKIQDGEFEIDKDFAEGYITKDQHPLCKRCVCEKGCSGFCKIVMKDIMDELPLSCLFNQKLFEYSLIKVVDIMNSSEKMNFINGIKKMFNS